MINRRRFLKQVSGGIIAAAGSNIGSMTSSAHTSVINLGRGSSKRIFVARFAHETNTFHPVPTSSWRFSETGGSRLSSLEKAGTIIIPGVSASPEGGGLLLEKPCREAMARILESLSGAMPVDAVFLQLHGAMYAEGVGHAETVLVEEVRKQLGPKVPITCTFDLHGNIPSRMSKNGDILAGLKTAPHTDSAETAEHAAKILVETLQGKVNPV